MARPSRSEFFLSSLLLLALLIGSTPALSRPIADEAGERWLAKIELHTETELYQALKRAAALFESGQWRVGVDTPVVFVLHGAEAKALLRERYQQHKALVDLAARLTAFEVVEVKVCETWMGGERISREQLPPFIDTVPFGPDAEKRLLEQQGYQYF